MAQIAFVLLCHKDPDAIVQQAIQLTAAGDYVAIHFDARATNADYTAIKAALADNANVVFAKRQVKCGWGEWSLVQATLNALSAAVEAFPRASHFYMVSGDCMPIKSSRYARQLLDDNDADFIESFDFMDGDWIKTGFKEERLVYRHLFNERTQKRAFYLSLAVQRRLGLKRNLPDDLQIMIGSQWWCLRRRTIEWILEFTETRRDVVRFFRTTWIPDETYFQTLVRHLIPGNEIENRTLTFLMFSDYGMPVMFHNDHYDLLTRQDALFARKISPEATTLKSRLGTLYASDQDQFEIADEGRNLFGFLTGRGRVGRRFGSRFWERQTSLGRKRELLIIACKKWHVAKRLVGAINDQTDVPALAYLFNEEDTALPDLGGIQSTLWKRTRHRRALVGLLMGHFDSERLVICLDIASLDLMRDFDADRATVRVLEISCTLTDDYLIGHAERVGLAGAQAGSATLTQLLPAIRNDVSHESDAIRDADFTHYALMSETATVDQNAQALAQFLGVSADVAQTLAKTPHLFVD